MKNHSPTLLFLAGFGVLALCLFVIALPYLLNKTFDKRTYVEKATTTIDYRQTAPDSPFMQSEEAVVIDIRSSTSSEIVAQEILPVEKVLFEYIEIIDSCGPHYEGECVRVRSGPGVDYPAIARLRNSMVLKVGGKIERDGAVWYKIVFDEWLRYPERVENDWYVSADFADVLLYEGDMTVWDEQYEHASSSPASTTKKIIVDRSEQKLYAYENDVLYIEIPISTGLELTPTPRGTFTIFKKSPSRYMQGPIPGLADQQTYDLPGVPWNLYFTHGGAVIHGAYWHTSFGSQYSHGCVNLLPYNARLLYEWAGLGTRVIVRD